VPGRKNGKRMSCSNRFKRNFNAIRADLYFGSEWAKVSSVLKFPEAKPYVALKETLVAYYTGTFSIAIKQRRRLGKICYLDATAGAGINIVKVGNKTYPVFGTSLIGMVMPTYGLRKLRNISYDKLNPFDRIVAVESHQVQAHTLEKIADITANRLRKMGYVAPDFKIYRKDFNQVVDTIFNNYDDCAHWLVVIDPYGAEIKWETVENILNTGKADVIFNFMCGALRRQVPHACRRRDHAFDKFLGGREWRSAICGLDGEVGERLYEYFERLVRGRGYEVYPVSVEREEFEWHYHIMVLLRQRKGGHPWVNTLMGEMGPCVEELKDRGVELLFSNESLDRYLSTHTNIPL
jgi:three-Cys-motif partner protein